MKPETRALLRMARLLGYKRIGINEFDSTLPNCSFYRTSDYVCASPPIKFDGFICEEGFHTWPAIWNICERIRVEYGAGNGETHQIKWKSLDSGIYDLETIKL